MTTDMAKQITYRERAAFYEVEYDTTIDHAFLRRFATPEVSAILEIPAGAGRNVSWLAETGCFVMVADLEPAMVARLEAKISTVDATDRMRCVVADMRTLDLDASFDLILVPQGGFQQLRSERDALRALISLSRHLARGGSMVIDLAMFDPAAPGEFCIRPSYYDPTVPDGTIVEEWTRSRPEGGTVSRRRIQHHHEEELVVDLFYTLVEATGEQEMLHFKMRPRRYDHASFVRLAACAGLEPIRVYRNYSGDTFELGAAGGLSRLIYHLRLGRTGAAGEPTGGVANLEHSG